jgi:hypothetical protein
MRLLARLRMASAIVPPGELPAELRPLHRKRVLSRRWYVGFILVTMGVYELLRWPADRSTAWWALVATLPVFLVPYCWFGVKFWRARERARRQTLSR